jgi:hypothetical protein
MTPKRKGLGRLDLGCLSLLRVRIFIPLVAALGCVSEPAFSGQPEQDWLGPRDADEALGKSRFVEISESGVGRNDGRGSQWTATAAVEWVSKYLDQGREQFDGAGGIILGTSVDFESISLELLQGFADSNAAREFRGNLLLSHSLKNLELGLRTSIVSDTRGGPEVWEVAGAIAGELAFGVRWESEICYDIHSGGAYAEGSLCRNWEVSPVWELAASGAFGANFGSVADGHRGPDHLLLNVEMVRLISENSAICAGLGHQRRSRATFSVELTTPVCTMVGSSPFD